MKRYFITLISILALTGIIGTALASPPKNEESFSGNSITSSAKTVNINEAKEMLGSTELQLPTELPVNFYQDSIIYNEPTSVFSEKARSKVDIDELKEITIRYRDKTDNTSWIDYTTKKMEIEIMDEDAEDITINGVDGQFKNFPEQGYAAYNWFKDGVSHFIVAKNTPNEKVMKFIESIK
ncbi:hypothetical protein AMQ84_02710 [Paenibacillus riograndensis]|uniref:DUF4367 domain-containing protein n=1 Tax=Paenibacillus riograndensis TaxID=483937 RepID=A0A132UAZ6_9BACL|nr:hypothetical protein [Paenibacillus riograndensis]KWX80692.1 hypothetical protein AMQ84_02710 [Paenibacillus riograndensis]